MEFVSPVATYELVAALSTGEVSVVHELPSSERSTVYPVTSEASVPAGGNHRRVTWALPGAAVRNCGATTLPAGVPKMLAEGGVSPVMIGVMRN